MVARRTSRDETTKSRRPPATTPEARENQVVSAAMDLAERQILDGTASAQVITHFLKLASPREKLEQERLKTDIELAKAKVDQLANIEKTEELYKAALNAMSSYQGREAAPVDDYED